jgi:hypothetical protein
MAKQYKSWQLTLFALFMWLVWISSVLAYAWLIHKIFGPVPLDYSV